MNWEDEQFIKVYTRDTTTWHSLTWEARSVFLHLLRKVDRAGVIDLDRHGSDGVARLLDIPETITKMALTELADYGCIEWGIGRITVPNFLEAQTARPSDRLRQKESRMQRRDKRHKEQASPDTCHKDPVAGDTCHSRLDQTRSDQTRLDTSVGTEGRTKLVRDYFSMMFKEATGLDYPHSWGRDGKAISSLPASYSPKFIMELIDLYFLDQDPFVAKTGRTIPGFCSRIAAYVAKHAIVTQRPSVPLVIAPETSGENRAMAREVIREMNAKLGVD